MKVPPPTDPIWTNDVPKPARIPARSKAGWEPAHRVSTWCHRFATIDHGDAAISARRLPTIGAGVNFSQATMLVARARCRPICSSDRGETLASPPGSRRAQKAHPRVGPTRMSGYGRESLCFHCCSGSCRMRDCAAANALGMAAFVQPERKLRDRPRQRGATWRYRNHHGSHVLF